MAESFFHKYCEILFANETNSTEETSTRPPPNGTAISNIDTEVTQVSNSRTSMEGTAPSPPGEARHKLTNNKIALILASWVFVGNIVSLIYMGTYNHVPGVATFINWCPR